jgi:hypothetical protein
MHRSKSRSSHKGAIGAKARDQWFAMCELSAIVPPRSVFGHQCRYWIVNPCLRVNHFPCAASAYPSAMMTPPCYRRRHRQNVRSTVKAADEKGVAQVVYYNAGVGSGGPLDRFLGGVFGVGLRDNVKRGLAFLSLV